MKPRFIFILFVLGILGVLIACTRQPRYHGRTLTRWLQQYRYASLDETQRLQEAQAAIQAIGVKRVLQSSLKLVEAKDDPVSLWIIDTGDRLRISDEIGLRFIRWHSAEDFQQLGIAGFEVLGTNAAPAVGELARLLDEPDHAFTAFRCLASVGKPAEFALCQCLTNQDLGVRQASVFTLASVTDDVEAYIDRIKGSLGDSSEFVRSAAVDGISAQTAVPDLAVPLLLTALKDSSDHVSSSAANSLADFGTNALSAVPALSNLVEHGGLNAANAALRTLMIIAPNESLPILTNCIARGKPSTGGALKVLVTSANCVSTAHGFLPVCFSWRLAQKKENIYRNCCAFCEVGAVSDFCD